MAREGVNHNVMTDADTAPRSGCRALPRSSPLFRIFQAKSSFWRRFNRASLLIVAVLVNASCDQRGGSGAIFPLAPTQGKTTDAPVTPVTPIVPVTPGAPVSPRPPGIDDVASIAVGDVVHRTIGTSPPECVEFAGWPCQYFKLVAPRSGIVVVELHFDSRTQALQVVDVSLNGVWAQDFGPDFTRLTAKVTEGVEYIITLWYTFPRLDYELRVTMPE
jgi:hypothetical protein